jgi:hypothetical protein
VDDVLYPVSASPCLVGVRRARPGTRKASARPALPEDERDDTVAMGDVSDAEPPNDDITR